MKRFLCLSAFFTLSLTLSGFAQEEERYIAPERVQGNYHGTINGDTWGNYTVRAEVVAQNEKMFRAVFYIGTDGDMDRVEVKGRTHEMEVNFEDEVELSGTRKGKFSITGQIKKEVFSGLVTGANVKVPFHLEHVFIKPPTLGAEPPAGAIVLMDGTNLDQWVRIPEKWCLTGDGAMEVCSSSLRTKEEFGSGAWHIEFRTPFMPNDRGQARGNSGVYIFGRYEVQVLDSFGDLPMDNLCGGIYKEATPLLNAGLPPLEWQTYDITYTAPEFDANGTKTKNAIINVVHNGITIHDNVALSGATPGGITDKEGTTGPLMLQDHHNPVRYRNIWFVPKG